MDDPRNQGPEHEEVYDRRYYATHCGALPYDHSCGFWAGFFGNIADHLIRSFRPKRVFDAGCAHGFLVEAFWDRGVEAWGRDISKFANSDVRRDLRQYCAVGSISDPIEGRYDLVTCIEVLEHMPEAEAIRAIEAMSKVADRILFSSSPTDLDEPTHINVRPAIYWLRQFAAYGFAPDMGYDATFVLPHTLVLERVETAPSDRDLFACAELVRVRLLSAERERVAGKLQAEQASLKHELVVERARVEYELARERPRIEHELVVERARIEHELEVERAQINQVEAELIRALCELEAERERAVRELEAERERAVRELELERERAARELGAERERIRLRSLGKRVERSTRLGVRRCLKFVRHSAGLPWRAIQGIRGESL
jgi:SAM-dependent methyltransferase